MFKYAFLSGVMAAALAACSSEQPSEPTTPVSGDVSAAATFGRDQIRIVGSSTVYPFSTATAEAFGRGSNFKTPIVESTGSGGGMRLFCAGTGEAHPDITNASRRIKASEVALCAENDITDIVEVKIGYDGIVLANSRKAEPMDITLAQLFLALAKETPDGNGGLQANPHTKWSDIDASLPDVKIEVLGPPPTSGTRDAFVELAMEGGCQTFDFLSEMKSSDKDQFKVTCHTIREDGAFIEAGENDNLIVQKLDVNPAAFGVFGYSFLDQNAGAVQGSSISGIASSFENISDGTYPVARSLYFYLKTDHVEHVPGLESFVSEFTSEAAIGPDGYLSDKGLIPMQDEERSSVRASVENLTSLSLD